MTDTKKRYKYVEQEGWFHVDDEPKPENRILPGGTVKTWKGMYLGPGFLSYRRWIRNSRRFESKPSGVIRKDDLVRKKYKVRVEVRDE